MDRHKSELTRYHLPIIKLRLSTHRSQDDEYKSIQLLQDSFEVRDLKTVQSEQYFTLSLAQSSDEVEIYNMYPKGINLFVKQYTKCLLPKSQTKRIQVAHQVDYYHLACHPTQRCNQWRFRSQSIPQLNEQILKDIVQNYKRIDLAQFVYAAKPQQKRAIVKTQPGTCITISCRLQTQRANYAKEVAEQLQKSKQLKLQMKTIAQDYLKEQRLISPLKLDLHPDVQHTQMTTNALYPTVTKRFNLNLALIRKNNDLCQGSLPIINSTRKAQNCSSMGRQPQFYYHFEF